MKNLLIDILHRCPDSQYADIRYERRIITEVTIDMSGVYLTSCEKMGGFCRIMASGGVSKFVFSDPEWGRRMIAQHRITIGNNHSIDGQHQPIPIPPPRVYRVRLRGERWMSERPLEEKIHVLGEYLTLACSFRVVAYAKLQYREEYVRKYFANNFGSFIEQEQQSAFCLIELFLHNSQWVIDVLNGFQSFDGVMGQHARIESLGRFAESTSLGIPVAKGRYTVILDPQLAGAVIHETVAHLSEADNSLRSARVRGSFQIGSRVALPLLSVIDDPTLPDLPGSYAYDDEGVAASRTKLIWEGRVVGKLHSLATAQLFETKSTGNARAVDFTSEPIVRSSNTLVLPGKRTVEEIIESVRDGLYLRGIRGGMTFGDRFVYRVCGGNCITNGRIAKPIGNLSIRGDILEFLWNIVDVGNLPPSLHSPFCVKKGQGWLPVWSGSPAMKVENVSIEV